MVPFRREIKLIDTAAFNNNPPGVGGSLVCLNLIAEGSGPFARIGRRVEGLRLVIDYSVAPPTGSTLDWGTINVVYDKQPNGSLPAFATIFDVTSVLPYTAGLNIAQWRDRFISLKRMALPAISIGSCSEPRTRGRITISLRRMRETQYGSSSAAVPDTGAIYLAIASANNTAATISSMAFTITTRYEFYDD